MKVKILKTCRVAGKQLTAGATVEIEDGPARSLCLMKKAAPVSGTVPKPGPLSTQSAATTVKKPAAKKKPASSKPVKKGKK